MLNRTFGGFLAIALTASCASFHATTIPKWERYRQGELAGFLRSPAEQIVDSTGKVREWAQVPPQAVRLARGRIEYQSDRRVVGPVTDTKETNPASQTANVYVDPVPGRGTPTFLLELRGPGPSDRMRTLATRSWSFDFGPVPDGTYSFKATVVEGFGRAVVGTITVSGSADPAALITLVL